MFELKAITECELTTFVGRTQKSGPEDVPAVSIRLRLTGVDNAMLDMFSASLRPAIYTAVPGQEDLPGIPPSTPLLRSKDVTHLAPDFRFEGWTVFIARGLNDDALQMGTSKVDDFKFDFHEGGRIDMDFRISSADVDEEGAGMLWGRQKRKVFARIIAPELPEKREGTEATGADIDGTQAAFEADHPDATDLFAAAHGTPDPDEDGGDAPVDEPDDEGAATDVEQAAPAKRTRRSRAAA